MNEIEKAIEELEKLKKYAFKLESPDSYFIKMNGMETELSLVLSAFSLAVVTDVAISALEKQIAEKIEKDIVIDEDYSGNTYEREIPVCLSCNNIYLASKQSYCNQCGQRLDWSAEE